MLKDSKITRIINSIGIAEYAKIEGLSSVAKDILGADDIHKNIFADIISQLYKDLTEEIKDGDKLGYVRLVGCTLTLPLTLTVLALSKLGFDIKVALSLLREEKNLAALVSHGVIKEEDIPRLIEKISLIRSDYKLDAGEYFENQEEYRQVNAYHEEKGIPGRWIVDDEEGFINYSNEFLSDRVQFGSEKNDDSIENGGMSR